MHRFLRLPAHSVAGAVVAALVVTGCSTTTTGAVRPAAPAVDFGYSGAQDMAELGYTAVGDHGGTGDGSFVLDVADGARVVVVVACTGPEDVRVDVGDGVHLVDGCGSGGGDVNFANSAFTWALTSATVRVTAPASTTWWIGVGTRVVTT